MTHRCIHIIYLSDVMHKDKIFEFIYITQKVYTVLSKRDLRKLKVKLPLSYLLQQMSRGKRLYLVSIPRHTHTHTHHLFIASNDT